MNRKAYNVFVGSKHYSCKDFKADGPCEYKIHSPYVRKPSCRNRRPCVHHADLLRTGEFIAWKWRVWHSLFIVSWRLSQKTPLQSTDEP